MRSRNIKPGFFKNTALADCSPLARILFAGLWCLADREGRLKDDPRLIKAELLPYDDADVNALLSELAGAGFIDRYEIDGRKYVQVCNFVKHQNPHKREADSDIPSRPEKARPRPDLGTAQAEPKPEQGRALTGSSPADSGFLIPDSGFRIPDSKATRKQKPFLKPTVEEVAAYCSERGNAIDPDRFVNYYEAIGWVVGPNPMQNWKACVRNWEKRENTPANGRGQAPANGSQARTGMTTAEKVEAQRAERAEMEKFAQKPLTRKPWQEGQNGQ